MKALLVTLLVSLPTRLADSQPANGDESHHLIVQGIVTVLAVINPVVCSAIFLNLTPKLGAAEKRWAAIRIALSILIILVVSALIGLKILNLFGISLDVFRIVGGTIIALMGFDMLKGGHTVAQAPPAEDGANSLGPLIMFAAGPGTITAIVTLAAHASGRLPMTAIIAALVGAGVTLVVLLGAVRMASHVNRNTQAIVTRFMGLIVASMGMQFVLAGLKAFLK